MILREAQKLILKYGYPKVTMTDIANACQISRTTLYKSYPNKESIVVGLINESLEHNIRETEGLALSDLSFRGKLERFFDVWTLQPAASVIELDTGRDILQNVSSYAPDAVNNHYEIFQAMLAELIRGVLPTDSSLDAEDLAYIFSVTSRGIKADAQTLETLTNQIDLLIDIIIKTVEPVFLNMT
ncbi:MAG: TetR/AcrR family transcriptional regulator [Marinomonas foliarum]|uniref:TetR/AcrR family transcriptional regulator n=1 Tax=Marinomonas foliarum TaxID=491950 RepID=UPI003F9B2431